MHIVKLFYLLVHLRKYLPLKLFTKNHSDYLKIYIRKTPVLKIETLAKKKVDPPFKISSPKLLVFDTSNV